MTWNYQRRAPTDLTEKCNAIQKRAPTDLSMLRLSDFTSYSLALSVKCQSFLKSPQYQFPLWAWCRILQTCNLLESFLFYRITLKHWRQNLPNYRCCHMDGDENIPIVLHHLLVPGKGRIIIATLTSRESKSPCYNPNFGLFLTAWLGWEAGTSQQCLLKT